MASYQVLLFDLVGVLVQDDDDISDIILGWSNMSMAEMWQMWLTSPAVRAFDSGKISAHDFASGMVGELKLEVSPVEFMTVFSRWPGGLFPGVEAMLNQLRARYRLACLSNMNDLHWPMIRDEFGVVRLLDDIFVSHEIGLVKPDEALFRHVLERLNCQPGQIAFFDDNEPNIVAAQSLGIDGFHTQGGEDLNTRLVHLGLLDGH